jgi:hypothetical protein
MDNEGLAFDFFCHENAFPAGTTYISEGAEQALAASGEQPLPFLCAHLAKNWG